MHRYMDAPERFAAADLLRLPMHPLRHTHLVLVTTVVTLAALLHTTLTACLRQVAVSCR